MGSQMVISSSHASVVPLAGSTRLFQSAVRCRAARHQTRAHHAAVAANASDGSQALAVTDEQLSKILQADYASKLVDAVGVGVSLVDHGATCPKSRAPCCRRVRSDKSR